MKRFVRAASIAAITLAAAVGISPGAASAQAEPANFTYYLNMYGPDAGTVIEGVSVVLTTDPGAADQPVTCTDTYSDTGAAYAGEDGYDCPIPGGSYIASVSGAPAEWVVDISCYADGISDA